jgi:hypothetical protein
MAGYLPSFLEIIHFLHDYFLGKRMVRQKTAQIAGYFQHLPTLNTRKQHYYL